MGYHVGAKSYKSDALKRLSSYPNNCTIGIEMCVNVDGNFKKMYQNSLELAADILKRYGWGVDQLWRHYDITGKNCPAYFVTDSFAKRFFGLSPEQAWAKFKDDVQKLLTGSPQKNQTDVDKVSIEINRVHLPAQGYLMDGVSHLPIRAVAEAVGGKIEWCAQTKQVKVNGHDLTETIESGVSYAPARELAIALNLQVVDWNQSIKTVKLSKGCIGKST
jgi:hypothetical protein